MTGTKFSFPKTKLFFSIKGEEVMVNRKVTIFVILAVFMLLCNNLFSQNNEKELTKLNHKLYDEITNRMEIIPGMWRPLFGSEQVAWISPPWESQEYVWLDFPEAMSESLGKLIYLGHIN